MENAPPENDTTQSAGERTDHYFGKKKTLVTVELKGSQWKLVLFDTEGAAVTSDVSACMNVLQAFTIDLAWRQQLCVVMFNKVCGGEVVPYALYMPLSSRFLTDVCYANQTLKGHRLYEAMK